MWGNAEGIDNIVWGNSDDDNIVWGNNDDDNIVWGNNDDDNIVWGNNGDDNIVGAISRWSRVVFGDETNEVNSLPSSMWDAMFPLDASWPATPSDTSDPDPRGDDRVPTEPGTDGGANDQTVTAQSMEEPAPVEDTSRAIESVTSLSGRGGLY